MSDFVLFCYSKIKVNFHTQVLNPKKDWHRVWTQLVCLHISEVIFLWHGISQGMAEWAWEPSLPQLKTDTFIPRIFFQIINTLTLSSQHSWDRGSLKPLICIVDHEEPQGTVWATTSSQKQDRAPPSDSGLLTGTSLSYLLHGEPACLAGCCCWKQSSSSPSGPVSSPYISV